MNQIELLEHVLGNLKAGNKLADGLLKHGKNPDSDVIMMAWNFPEYYTLAPRKHDVNGFDVPAPEGEELELNTTYFISNIQDKGFFYDYVWESDAYDRRHLKRGLIHLTKEAAIANAKAMCGIDPEAEIGE